MTIKIILLLLINMKMKIILASGKKHTKKNKKVLPHFL